jgi:hypothetical protein
MMIGKSKYFTNSLENITFQEEKLLLYRSSSRGT